MSDQREQRLSTGAGSLRAIPWPIVDLAAIALAITLVVLAWDNTAAATTDVAMRLFLIGWAVAAVIVSVGIPFTGGVSGWGRSISRSELPPAVYHVLVGLVIGLAAGTTDRGALQLAGWWQLWWTVPLLMAYVSRVILLRRSWR
jgi:hypothetical protein